MPWMVPLCREGKRQKKAGITKVLSTEGDYTCYNTKVITSNWWCMQDAGCSSNRSHGY